MNGRLRGARLLLSGDRSRFMELESGSMLLIVAKFFTPSRCTLQLNMLFGLEHVFHAEPLHTSAKHALWPGACFSRRTAAHFG